MNRALTLAVLAVLAVLLLGACSHSRIVQREPGTRGAPPRSTTAARPAIAPLPANGVHVVRRGETLYGISFRYGLRYQDVAVWNRVGDTYLIEVGQRLRLSPPGRQADRPVASRPAPPPTRAPDPVRGSAPASGNALPGAPTASASMPPSAGTPAWRWPAQGELVGRYVAGDRTRQGIDIAGRAGQDVLAAADGVVVYSGAGLVGYGELIIVKHSEEWLSAYAHNQKRLVGEGTRVAGGQVIAHMGRTGAPRDMLHFEIRRNGKPVDPLAQLPRR